MQTTSLRDVVSQKLAVRWEAWSADHPHLAAAVDRMKLIDSSVQSLRDDAEFREAMRQADLDEAKLAAAARVLEKVEGWVTRWIPV
ncbi:MAG: hypothetical protein IT442_11980 [Phycisphaeraceae bacterium]|nr:hypothetical protein [Phycisphaeraceae bacterium]